MLPSLGYSIYMWASILGMTLSGLAIGYKLGGILAKKENGFNYLLQLSIALIINLALIRFLVVDYSPFILSSYKATVLIHSGLLCLPITLILGAFSPLIISKFHIYWNYAVSIIFTSSTIGGIVFTLISVWYITPTFGIDKLLNILIFFAIAITTILLVNKKALQ